ncbi:hypothetical protein [Fimbriiglobus ruber]|uniref:Uncharacterized protein n=1 Tax=Fimbriiglobus ruber TaxID=1908690 RepID=A0A225DHM9_9BACT|nr:hypothetical protein [Fimbriiglobus ruber]OWK40981.1 hypothetical protein FRUB_04873 [Fimbriiglobus ruber]
MLWFDDFFRGTNPVATRVGVAVAGIGVALILGLEALTQIDLVAMYGPGSFLALVGWAAVVGASTCRMVAGWMDDKRTEREGRSGPRVDVAPVPTHDGPGTPDLSPADAAPDAGRRFQDRVIASIEKSAGTRSRGR